MQPKVTVTGVRIAHNSKGHKGSQVSWHRSVVSRRVFVAVNMVNALSECVHVLQATLSLTQKAATQWKFDFCDLVCVGLEMWDWVRAYA